MPVAEAYREPKVHHPRTNWAEVDPEDWWEATVGVIRETLQRAGTPSQEILGIGFCGLQHVLVPVDSEGRSLARAMLWMDQRCQPQVAWLAREHRKLVEEMMGQEWAFSTTPSAPKLRWIVENEAELLHRTYKFLLVKDFIRFRLSGTAATDPYDAAGTGLFDWRAGEWSHRMLDLIEMPGDKMPPVQDPTQVVGGVTEEAAQATGLAPGTPLVVGGGDVLCTCTGANALSPERACLYLGTAAWISVPGVGGSILGATATTGASLRWLGELLESHDPQRFDSDLPHGSLYTALLREAESVPPGSRGLIFLPHLMGERSPQHDPAAKGVLFGLTLAHGRGEVVRAVLEGCAFQLRRILESSGSGRMNEMSEMVAVGGGAKSALWLDILADVTDIELLVPRVLEAGALGAAVLAGVGVGVYSSVEEAAEALVRVVDRHEPDGTRKDFYGRIYSIFSELEGRVAPLYGMVPAQE
jgi:xylulokinase